MISIIIPVLNEERALPATLARVFTQAGDYEVIVVDGGSTDNTRRLIANDPRIRLLAAPAGRASQMNAGARQACGEWLLFLHADTLLPDDGVHDIQQQPPDILAARFIRVSVCCSRPVLAPQHAGIERHFFRFDSQKTPDRR